MPIYEYRCDACGHQEEFLQRVSEPPLTDCPVCRKPTFNKLLSAAGFQLKAGAARSGRVPWRGIGFPS